MGILSIFFFIIAILTLIYTALILYYRVGWVSLREIKLDKTYLPKTKVSILIPARNEANKIGNLLKDIFSQYYPTNLMEVIVIDDHSTDDTSTIVKSFGGVIYISLQEQLNGTIINSYKKKAIEIGISQSSGELMFTTDADCRISPYWLLSIVSFYESRKYHLIASPVLFSDSSNWFDHFQSLDFMTMQGITGALSHFKAGSMCNGANLAYTREAFNKVNGFSGIDDIASGDDMLLMHKIESQFPKRTGYLKCKESIVSTAPSDSIKAFFQQRIRWASKATKFNDKRILIVLALVYLFNFTLLAAFLGALFYHQYLWLATSILLVKSIVELYFLIPVSQFFNKQKELNYFFILQLIHIPYIVVSGLFGQFGTYTWKGRTVK